MNGNRWKSCWGMAAVLVVGGLAGCQQMQPTPTTSFATDIGAGHPTPKQAADVQVALGRTLEQRGELTQAIAAYAEATRRDPSRADACWRLALLHDRKGKFADSAEWYGRALAAAPNNADIYCDMGYSFYLQRRHAESEKCLRQAIALKADHPRATNNLGLLLTKIGRTEEALACFRKAADENDARLNLAAALMLNERWEAAREQYAAVFEDDPSKEAAQTGLHRVAAFAARAKREAPQIASRLEEIPAAEVISNLQLETEENGPGPTTAPEAGTSVELPRTASRLEELPAQEISSGWYNAVGPKDTGENRIESIVEFEVVPTAAIESVTISRSMRTSGLARTFFRIEIDVP